MAGRPNFRDADHLYRVFDAIFSDLFADPEVGPRLRDSGLIVQWAYTDPDATVTFNLRDAPRPGFHADWQLGPTTWTPDVTTFQSASFGLGFIQGRENPMTAVARGQVKAKGRIGALLKLVPLGRPMARKVRATLRRIGEDALVIPKKAPPVRI
jgi:hypothetical protein